METKIVNSEGVSIAETKDGCSVTFFAEDARIQVNLTRKSMEWVGNTLKMMADPSHDAEKLYDQCCANNQERCKG